MTFRRRQINQSSLSQHNNSVSGFTNLVFFREGSNVNRGFAHFTQGDQVKLQIKMAAVTNDRAVLQTGTDDRPAKQSGEAALKFIGGSAQGRA